MIIGKPGLHRVVELIDTLWNVNLVGVGAASVGVAELIDTLWNVNYNAIQ